MNLGDKCDNCNLVCGPENAVEVIYPEGTQIEYADPCMGVLPGVSFGCCGHGDPYYAYLAFENGTTIRMTPRRIEKQDDWEPGKKFAHGDNERIIVGEQILPKGSNLDPTEYGG